jgi:hypothetical protein
VGRELILNSCEFSNEFGKARSGEGALGFVVKPAPRCRVRMFTYALMSLSQVLVQNQQKTSQNEYDHGGTEGTEKKYVERIYRIHKVKAFGSTEPTARASRRGSRPRSRWGRTRDKPACASKLVRSRARRRESAARG